MSETQRQYKKAEQFKQGNAESQDGSEKKLECASVNRKRFDGLINEARTIMSRDYKGFGSGRDTQNGVLESGED